MGTRSSNDRGGVLTVAVPPNVLLLRGFYQSVCIDPNVEQVGIPLCGQTRGTSRSYHHN
jgi:hypothetical protein